MTDPANAYRAIEQALATGLGPYQVKVVFGRKGGHGHGNAEKLVRIIPRGETFAAPQRTEEVPNPVRTRNCLPIIEIRAPEFDDADSIVNLVVDILDEAFKGAYTLGAGAWYDEDQATVKGEMYRLPLQLATQVPNRNASDETTAEVTSTESDGDILYPPETPPPAPWSPAERAS